MDSEFGDDGFVITEISENRDFIHELGIQNDGKIVAAGEVYLLDFVLARYLSDLDVGLIDFSLENSSLLIYPNPIRQTAILKYELLSQEIISLELLDIKGRLLKTFSKMKKGGLDNILKTFLYLLKSQKVFMY